MDLSAVATAFGAAVASHRSSQGISQREFARAVSISNSHLRKIEGGEASPSLGTVFRIAGALGVPADELVRETTERMTALV